jgi:hypothetical protein
MELGDGLAGNGSSEGSGRPSRMFLLSKMVAVPSDLAESETQFRRSLSLVHLVARTLPRDPYEGPSSNRYGIDRVEKEKRIFLFKFMLFNVNQDDKKTFLELKLTKYDK